MIKQKWMVQNKKADFAGLGQALGIDPVTVRLLRNRGLTTEEEMRVFLSADETQFLNPHLMKDMDKGVAIVAEAIRSGDKIRIIGDYDADGITSSYILHRTITYLNGDVSVAIPHRVKDGYGLNVNLINACKEDEIKTILTCDNGVSAGEALELAHTYGMRTVVTDHHQIPGSEMSDGTFTEDEIPADAIINPKQQDCVYPFKGLCGAGVAYKFSCALLEMMTGEAWEQISTLKKELLIYAAIGTVGDVMDLLGENRAIVKCGLNYLKTSDDVSLLSLLEQCGLKKEQVKAGNIGFKLAPCLNASGRIDSPQHAMDLLLHKDPEYCRRQAERLVAMNEERKQLTERYVSEAVNIAAKTTDSVLVIYLPECHESIAGIVAGRIRERFFKPTLIITRSEECCKGSGRSIEAYEMYRELSKVKELFLKFGGHAMAVGFSIAEDNISTLREKLNQNSILTEEDLGEKVSIDVPMPMDYASVKLLEELKMLEPHGKGNPTPLFAQKDVELRYVQVVGKDKKFIKMFLSLPNGKKVEGIYFVTPEEFRTFLEDSFKKEIATSYMSGKRGEEKIAVCYQPEINVYNGLQSVQYVVKYIS